MICGKISHNFPLTILFLSGWAPTCSARMQNWSPSGNFDEGILMNVASSFIVCERKGTNWNEKFEHGK